MSQPNNFVPIGPNVYLSKGRKDADDLNLNNPTLVLIFGWMGAQLPHLHKYTQVYEELYPGATKVLIRCPPSFFWSTTKAQHAHISPVVEVLEAFGCISSTGKTVAKDNTPRILIHAFSNGGAAGVATLGQMLPQTPSSPRLTCAIILDSAPGSGNLETTKRAFLGLVRNRLARFVGGLFLTALYLYSWAAYILVGTKGPTEVLKENLNSPQLLPWIDEHTPRLYIYSKKDELVMWEEVQAHAAEAQKIGINVTTELFEQSPHVAHARADPARYWAAVGCIWSDALQHDQQVGRD